jgi:hypothetical protein
LNKPIRRSLLPVCVLMAGVAHVSAQTAALMLVNPWEADRAADFQADGWGQSVGRADQSGMDVRLSRYQAAGRWRLDPADTLSPTAAISAHRLDISSSDPALPQRLVDVSVAGSMVFDVEPDTTLQVILGGGYAGDNAFGDGRAYYALADLVLTRSLGQGRGYMLILDYDGNRTIVPDVPLPGYVYYDRLDAQTTYTLGFPSSSITWKPNDRTTLRATYLIPTTVKGIVEYEVAQPWSVYASFDSSLNAYKLDTDGPNRRLLFAQQRIEAGAVWRGRQGGGFPGVEVRAAFGYAFDQQFTRGFDVKDDQTVRDISDEPYVRVALTMGF